jgi:Tfp pilus assembly protein PilV
MRPRLLFRRLRLPRAEDGFTMIEVIAAAFVLTVGVLGLLGAFDSSRKLSLRSERQSVMAHRAQLEIERLQSYPYSELAMTAAPAHSSEATNPYYYVSGNEYQWDPSSASKETLAIAAGGVVAAEPGAKKCPPESLGPCEWVDGLASGTVYDFVTWHTDGNCGAKCPASENYKRLTVVVTIKVPNAGSEQPAPVRVSTLIAKQG